MYYMKPKKKKTGTKPKEEQTEEEDEPSVFGTKNKVEQSTG